MSVVFVMVFAAIILAGAFLIAFIWSVKSGQYDDTYTPSVRILFDDPPIQEEESEKRNATQDQKVKTGNQKVIDENGKPK